MTEFIKGMYRKKYFWQRLAAMLVSIVVMGFALSLLVRVNWGTDPCTTLNLAISEKIGMSLGSWQALFNTFLFLFVVLWGRNFIGFGTLANMILVGYSVDFFSWIWNRLFGEGYFESISVKIAVLIPALAVFVVSVGVYMVMDLGTAPYDALPFLIQRKLHTVSFRTVRMVWDMTMLVVGILLGGQAGIVSILMAFFIGPAIAWVEKKIKSRVDF